MLQSAAAGLTLWSQFSIDIDMRNRGTCDDEKLHIMWYVLTQTFPENAAY